MNHTSLPELKSIKNFYTKERRMCFTFQPLCVFFNFLKKNKEKEKEILVLFGVGNLVVA
jgi:hypothetical protein